RRRGRRAGLAGRGRARIASPPTPACEAFADRTGATTPVARARRWRHTARRCPASFARARGTTSGRSPSLRARPVRGRGWRSEERRRPAARTPPRGGGGGRRSHLRHALERFFDLRGRVLVVLQLAGQVRLVGPEIEVAVARQVEEDRAALAV